MSKKKKGKKGGSRRERLLKVIYETTKGDAEKAMTLPKGHHLVLEQIRHAAHRYLEVEGHKSSEVCHEVRQRLRGLLDAYAAAPAPPV